MPVVRTARELEFPSADSYDFYEARAGLETARVDRSVVMKEWVLGDESESGGCALLRDRTPQPGGR